MKATKILLLSTALFLSGIFSIQNLNAQNCKGQKGNPEHAAEFHDCIFDDLTDAQKEKIEKINLNSDKKITNFKADLNIKKAELNKLMLSDSPDEIAIYKKVDEISVIKANIQKEKIARHLAIRNELTPEQKVKFDMHRSKMMGHNMQMKPMMEQHSNNPKCCNSKNSERPDNN